jgi:hypothetical protein
MALYRPRQEEIQRPSIFLQADILLNWEDHNRFLKEVHSLAHNTPVDIFAQCNPNI